MEQNRVNESSSKEQFKNDKNISRGNLSNLVENLNAQTESLKNTENITYQDVEKILNLQSKIYKAQMSRESSISDIVESSLVGTAGIVGAAALLSPILGPTAATVAALVVTAAYIFLNVKKTLPKPEQESDPTGDTNA